MQIHRPLSVYYDITSLAFSLARGASYSVTTACTFAKVRSAGRMGDSLVYNGTAYSVGEEFEVAPGGVITSDDSSLQVTVDLYLDIGIKDSAGKTPSLFYGDVARGVLVYGATPAGCAAAVGAARQGKPVILLAESSRVGGMLGWGINHQDVNVSLTPSLVSGFARELLARVGKQETNVAKTWQRWCRLSCDGRPSWFTRALNELLAAERNIQIVYNCDAVAVGMTGTSITSITLRNGAQYSGARVIDATYTGDLLALAGLSHVIGRESNALYGESLNGIRTAGPWTPPNGTALTTLDPYVTAGVPGSGLLPFVDGSGVGTVGAGDGRVMLFNYRLFVTNNAGDRVPFPLPNMTVYNPLNYELLARAMAAQPTRLATFGDVVTLYQSQINTSYFDLNSRVGTSTNYPNQAECREYIEATEARRAEIRENVKQYILGLFYWIRYSGDSRIPAGLVTNIATYGLVASELQATGGFSPELYVREGRRVVGDYVMDENDLILANTFGPEAVAFAYYDMDSPMVRWVNDAGVAKIEGAVLQALSASAAPQIGSYIPLKVLFPKVTECTNLLCPGSPSVSRPVWSTLRMEPVLMMLGQAAGISASLSIDAGTSVQSVSSSRVQRIMDPFDVWDGIVLSTEGALYAEGTVTQSPAASWTATSSRWGFIGVSALSDSNTGKGKTLTFAPNIQETGTYEVLFRYPPDATGRANNVTATVISGGVSTSVTVNQLYPGGVGGAWESLGSYTFRKGVPSADTVVIDTTGTTDFVVASAIKFVKRS